LIIEWLIFEKQFGNLENKKFNSDETKSGKLNKERGIADWNLGTILEFLIER
jgi:hypothetical protein